MSIERGWLAGWWEHAREHREGGFALYLKRNVCTFQVTP